MAGYTVFKDVNIFSFLSKKEETYNDLIKQTGKKAVKMSGVGRGGERVPGLAPGPGPQGSGLPALRASLAPLVLYSKNLVPSLKEVSQTLRSKGHMSRPPSEEAPGRLPNPQRFSISEEREPWDAQDYHPLIFQNAHITFVNEETSLLGEETSRSSLEDNLAGRRGPRKKQRLRCP